MADTAPFDYRVFLLRCWQESVPTGGEPIAPRFSLEDPDSGRRYGFSRAADLVDFLERSLAPGEDTSTVVPLRLHRSPEESDH